MSVPLQLVLYQVQENGDEKNQAPHQQLQLHRPLVLPRFQVFSQDLGERGLPLRVLLPQVLPHHLSSVHPTRDRQLPPELASEGLFHCSQGQLLPELAAVGGTARQQRLRPTDLHLLLDRKSRRMVVMMASKLSHQKSLLAELTDHL